MAHFITRYLLVLCRNYCLYFKGIIWFKLIAVPLPYRLQASSNKLHVKASLYLKTVAKPLAFLCLDCWCCVELVIKLI